CCAGAGVFAPARLKLDEDALVGLQLKARDVVGSLDANGHYLGAPSDTHEADFEQDLIGLVRVAGDLHAGIVLPLVETERTVPTLSETGWGLGDLALTARYEVVPVNTSPTLPGIAIVAGAQLPTGTPPEKASTPLATSATGIGTTQLSAGMELE